MRRALLIGCATYSDVRLRRLRAPAQDVAELAGVLRDPAVGQFAVDEVSDLPEHVVRRRIDRFFATADPDDLLLLYLSGHGLRDEAGQLFFAAVDTDLDQLSSTAVAASFVSGIIERSMCRSSVVVLDCCFSGSFPTELTPRSGDGVEIEGELGGRGRAVLASSRATEYSFEGGKLIKEEPVSSLFTRVLVRGLRGEAATPRSDGWITVNDLYDYAYQEIRKVTRSQTPTLSLGEMHGSMHIARVAAEPEADLDTESLLPTTAKSAAVVNTLRSAVPDFVGREDLLTRLGEVPRHGGVFAIHALGGMPGVGKTQLALHAAHQLADHYPDLQLYLDLQGFTPGRAPVAATTALESLLRAVDVPASQIPGDLEERAALWRARLAGRKVLLVLDNAFDEAQVAPLLPGMSQSLTLVTSRRTMVGLDGAELLQVDVLDEAAAAALFTRIISTGASDEEHVLRITALCGWLPLAIRLAAGRLRRRPRLGVAGLAAELAEADNRLDSLSGGTRGIRTAFDVSYAALEPDMQLQFRRLGLHPGPEISVRAAAALSGVRIESAEHALEELLNESLVQEPRTSRFVLHDLLRQYARDRCIIEDAPKDRRAAESRLIAESAAEAVAIAAALDEPATSEVERRRHQRWLERERGNLTAVAQLASDHGDPLAVALAVTVGQRLLVLGFLDDAEILFRSALDPAAISDDLAGMAAVELGLGDVARFTGRYVDSRPRYEAAERMYRSLADPAGQSKALYGLGEMARVQGDYKAAREHHTKGLALCSALGADEAEADALRGLGEVEYAVGNLEAALARYQRSIELSTTTEYRHGQLYGLVGMAETERDLGHEHSSQRHYEEATAIAEVVGDQRGLSNIFYSLGETARIRGEYENAGNHYRKVLDTTTKLGNRRGMAAALLGIAQVDVALGRQESIRDHLQAAISIFDELGDRRGRAKALTALGEIEGTDREAALAAWELAMTDYNAVGLPELASQLQDRITRYGRAHNR